MAGDFHRKEFDEATITKLEIFQLYTREWLPVFLAQEPRHLRSIYLFDFFCGPGRDTSGRLGSPLRTLNALREYSKTGLAGWGKLNIYAYFSDKSVRKTKQLAEITSLDEWKVPNVSVAVTPASFEEAFIIHEKKLLADDAAKLLLIDQCGVNTVTHAVFEKLVGFPRADFLFFISSSAANRFRTHPSIKLRIKPNADFNQVHHAVLDYYRELLPKGKTYYLAPFSIKKGSNIYGLIFGSAHPLGIDKFLSVAWNQDRLNGTANFDINRDAISPHEELLPLGALTQPTKLNVFNEALEQKLRRRSLKDELAVANLCYQHGVTRAHAESTLKKLKAEGVIDISFRVPSIENLRSPRPIIYPKAARL